MAIARLTGKRALRRARFKDLLGGPAFAADSRNDCVERKPQRMCHRWLLQLHASQAMKSALPSFEKFRFTIRSQREAISNHNLTYHVLRICDTFGVQAPS